MKYVLYALLILGIWLGMLLGISFLEAPLKFQAPNITLALGLSVGKLVFGALNKVELVFSILISIWMALNVKQINNVLLFVLVLLIGMVLTQTFWLLPILDVRADNVINGIANKKSHHHLVYIALEITKIISLLFLFIKIYKHD